MRVVFAACELQPALIETLKVTGVEVAVAPLGEPVVNQLGLLAVSIVKAVPPLAGDVTETVWEGTAE